MSAQDQEELESLTTWLTTFPCVSEALQRLSGVSNKGKNHQNILEMKVLQRPIFEVLDEILGSIDENEGSNTFDPGQTGNFWDKVLAATQRRKRSTDTSIPPGPNSYIHRTLKSTNTSSLVQHAALSALLCAAVTHIDLQQRKLYIERIMTLPQNMKRSLMSLIESRKREDAINKSKNATPTKPTANLYHLNASPSRSASSPFTPRTSLVYSRPHTSESNPSPRPPSTRRSFDQAFKSTKQDAMSDTDTGITPKRPSPKRVGVESPLFSPGLGDTAHVESQLRSLQEDKERLEHDLNKRKAQEEKLMMHLEETKACFRQKLIKAEAEASRRLEERSEEHRSQLELANKELEKFHNEKERAETLQIELLRLQEEKELYAHTQQELAGAQERLASYREKVQMYGDVQEALQREQEAHSKSVDECLKLKRQVEALLPIKRQVEEYQSRAVDSEIKLAETQQELQQIQEKGLLTGRATTDLEQICQTQQEEIRELRIRLQQETERGANKAKASGVGEGLSELNPEVKEEVLRLRQDNERLKKFRDEREDDAVSKLNQQMTDSKRLLERYKSQYLNTREQLEHTQRNLSSSQEREVKLRQEVKEGMEKIQEGQIMLEEVSNELSSCGRNLKISQGRENELEAELQKWINSTKALQENKNTIVSELRQCSENLESAEHRETKLQQKVSQTENDLQQERQSHQDVRIELESCQDQLKVSERKVSNLREQIEGWIKKSQSLEEKIRTMNGHIDKGKTLLLESRSNEERLTSQVSQATQFLSESNTKCEELMEELSQVRQEVATTKIELKNVQTDKERLQNDLADKIQLLQDTESISQQRQYLMESTRHKLESANADLELLSKSQATLQHELDELKKCSHNSEMKIEELQANLSETSNKLNTAKGENEKYKQENCRLLDEVTEKCTSLEKWKKKAMKAESSVERLDAEVNQIRSSLKQTELDLQTSKSHEETIGEDVQHAEQMIHYLEDTIDIEINHRRDIEMQLEATCNEMVQLQEAHDEKVAQLTAVTERQHGEATQMKQSLDEAKAKIDGLQSSLGASEHREKLLRLEVTKVSDNTAQLKIQLEQSQLAIEHKTKESEEALEATCTVIQTKAQSEINEIQSSLNKLLEEEREAKRQVEQSAKEKLQTLRREFEEKLKVLESSSHQHEEIANIKEIEIRTLKNDHEILLNEMKQSSEDEKKKLVAKGKKMLKDVKDRAKEEHEALQLDLDDLERRYAQEQEDKGKIILQAKTKVAQYKKKLEFSSARVTALTSDVDELETRIRSLEREKFKVSEENERYRRQLGGRGGPDSKLQGQFEQLQKEFKSAMEEARELRRKLKETHHHQAFSGVGLDTISENPDDPSYSRNAINQSTLVQLRSEYEETIEALNDEKRELVMKNSAASTDVQKAEKRAWDRERENSKLKQLNTSLQLQVERLENVMNNMETEGPPPPPPPGVPTVRSRRRKSDLTENEHITVNIDANQRSIPDLAVLASKGNDSNSDQSNINQPDSTSKNSDLPSFVDLHTKTSSAGETPPECQQS